MQEKMRELLKRRPFKPFQVRLSNGDAHIVRLPENVMLLKSRFVLFWQKSERFRVCDFSEVTDVEPVQTRKSKK